MARRKNGEELAAALASDYWSARDAEIVLRAQRASGLSEAEFSQRHGLRSERLERWRRRLGEPALASGWTGSEPQDFLPVRAIARAPLAVAGERDRAAGVMEVVLRGGRRVLVGADADPSAVARLVAALEGLAC